MLHRTHSENTLELGFAAEPKAEAMGWGPKIPSTNSMGARLLPGELLGDCGTTKRGFHPFR
jgi:hypothetical protein